MPTASVSLIFPTPILSTELGRQFTKEELTFCKPDSHTPVQNVGNTYSQDTYILDHVIMAGLKEACLEAVQVYINKVIKPREVITPYITQSWLNYTKKGQFMHKHNHTNSFLSGVLYVHADVASDRIIFHDQRYQQIVVPANEYDGMNSDSWWFPVKTGDIFIFPSHATHSVAPVTTDDVRISLAFNTFIDGIIGCGKRLTELKLRNELK